MARFRRSYVKRYIRTNALRRGVFGGSRFWTAVFAAGLVGRWFGKVTKRGDMPVITSDDLQPGEALLIRHLRPGED